MTTEKIKLPKRVIGRGVLNPRPPAIDAVALSSEDPSSTFTGCREMGECDGHIIQITVPHAPGHGARVRICKAHAKYLRDKLNEAIK